MSEEIILQGIRIDRINKIKDIFGSAADPLLFVKIARSGLLYWSQNSAEFFLRADDSMPVDQVDFISQVNLDLSSNGLSDDFDLISKIYRSITGTGITMVQTSTQQQTATASETTSTTARTTTTRTVSTTGGGRSGY